MTKPTTTEVSEFLENLNGGVLKEQMAAVLSEVAHAVTTFGAGKKTGKVNLSLTIKQVGDNQQVNIQHKLETLSPTANGKKSEDATTETVMHVGRGGQMTINQPQEDDNGQFALTEVAKINPSIAKMK